MNTLTMIVFNRMLSMFNLKIMKGKLLYEYKLNFGSIYFFVTELQEEGIRKLSNFLELPYIPWGDDIEDLYCALANSPYFSKQIFLNYYTTDKQYIAFKNYMKKENPISVYKPLKVYDFNAKLVDKFFNTSIYNKILQHKQTGISSKNLKNYFNGHLVMNWVPSLKPGKLLYSTMLEFKTHIEKRFDINFLTYLSNRPPNLIRLDFKFYYYNDFEFFEMEFTNKLPF